MAASLSSDIYDHPSHPLIREDDKTVYVIFRGSVALNDWKNSADFKSDRLCCVHKNKFGPRVHRGFLTEFHQVSHVIRDLSAYGAKDIVFAGHSLGGAIAAIAATHVAESYPGRVFVYTYGAPKPGNRAFARLVQARAVDVVDVVHDHDPVPHMPWWMYRAGRRVWLRGDGRPLPAMRRWWKRLRFWFAIDLFNDLKDHNSREYRRICTVANDDVFEG